MCHISCLSFGIKNLNKEEIENKRFLEVGSLCVNGSLRPFIENFNPMEYIGIDIEKGSGVDLVLANDLQYFKLYNIIFDRKIAQFKTSVLDLKYIKYLSKKIFRKTLVSLGRLILQKLN